MTANTSEVENIRVVVRLKPLSRDELELGETETLQACGQILTVNPPTEIDEASSTANMLKTPKTVKPVPPKTPKTSKLDSVKKMLFSSDNGNSNQAPTTPYATKAPAKAKTFAFDKIYDPQSSQREIFSDVEGFVESAVNGYNATIFAYGQTGAGKTHTMMGSTKDAGIIPRTIKRIFELVDQKPDTLFAIQITYVELYMDKFIDLLDPTSLPENKKKRLMSSAKPIPIEIHEDVNRSVFLTGGASIRTTVTNMADALKLIEMGTQSRTTALTQMNACSSRSHAILTFHIESRDNNSNAVTHVGKLHLVDLAGSERISKSGVEGANQKEAQHINLSLTALGDVLAALSSKNYNGPVPYRNSKLTRLLQDSLGGNSKTFFIVNVHSGASNYSETLMSLSYGQRAKKIKNLVTINQDTRGDSELQNLYNEIDNLQRKLINRTREFEKMQEYHATTDEENKKLKEKIERMSHMNQEEISNLELQMSEVVHSQSSQLTELSVAYSNLQKGLDHYKFEINQLKVKLVTEADEKENMRQQVELLQFQLDEATSINEALKEEQSEMEAKISQLESNEKKLKAKIADLTEEIESNSSNSSSDNQKLKVANARVSELKEELENAQSEVAKLKKELKNQKSHHVSSSDTDNSEYSAKIAKLEESVATLTKNLKQRDRELNHLTDEYKLKVTVLERSNGNLKRTLEEANSTIERLEAKVAELEKSLKQSEGVAAKAVASSKSGVSEYGRLVFEKNMVPDDIPPPYFEESPPKKQKTRSSVADDIHSRERSNTVVESPGVEIIDKQAAKKPRSKSMAIPTDSIPAEEQNTKLPLAKRKSSKSKLATEKKVSEEVEEVLPKKKRSVASKNKEENVEKESSKPEPVASKNSTYIQEFTLEDEQLLMDLDNELTSTTAPKASKPTTKSKEVAAKDKSKEVDAKKRKLYTEKSSPAVLSPIENLEKRTATKQGAKLNGFKGLASKLDFKIPRLKNAVNKENEL